MNAIPYHSQNVLGTALKPCCYEPLTGFYRDGYCRTGSGDAGLHTICAQMTEPFLKFSLTRGNDLITPRPELAFPGLQPGDKWCICLPRWIEAVEAGFGPRIDLEACHASVLEFVPIERLRAFAMNEGANP